MTNSRLSTILIAGLVPLFTEACASSSNPGDPQILSSSSTKVEGTVITGEMIGRGRGEVALSESASDPLYGFSEKSPVLVGGGFGEGSDRTYKYLNSLRASGGQVIRYDRVGTCCPFKSPNSPFDGEALLEVFEIVVPGLESPKKLYFNWYDEGVLLIPVGLSAGR